MCKKKNELNCTKEKALRGKDIDRRLISQSKEYNKINLEKSLQNLVLYYSSEFSKKRIR